MGFFGEFGGACDNKTHRAAIKCLWWPSRQSVYYKKCGKSVLHIKSVLYIIAFSAVRIL